MSYKEIEELWKDFDKECKYLWEVREHEAEEAKVRKCEIVPKKERLYEPIH